MSIRSPLFTKGVHRVLGASLLALVCGSGFVGISYFNILELKHHPLAAIPLFNWDPAIPFLPGWIWVYLFYYPFCFLPLFLKDVRDNSVTFTRTVTAYGLQFGVSFAFFLLWPLRMMHPKIPSGVDGKILGSLYAFDLGFNSFPSLHVANIVFVSLLIFRLKGRWWGTLAFAGAALIASSTVLVKQHFLSDVLAGALLGWASFIFSERIVSPEKSDPRLMKHYRDSFSASVGVGGRI